MKDNNDQLEFEIVIDQAIADAEKELASGILPLPLEEVKERLDSKYYN